MNLLLKMKFLMSKQYPSKIFLFGEYSILAGSKALALPYHPFSGSGVYGLEKKSNLKGLCNYLKAKSINQEDLNLDIEKLEVALDKGWSFSSNIPVGRGLGSSGALCACIVENFSLNTFKSENELKQCLSLVESYYHGESSGVDPLISFTQKTHLFSSLDSFESVSNIKKSVESLLNEFDLYLLDTGVEREGSSYIKIFLENLKDPDFQKKVEAYNLLNDLLIDKFLKPEGLKVALGDVSRFQLDIFKEMYTNEMRVLSENLLKKEQGFLKLCGAGGGGYYLLFLNKNINPIDLKFKKIQIHSNDIL